MSLFAPLRKELELYLPKKQIDTIYAAYKLASKAHKSQIRSSGESYITHPLAVATMLAEMRMDSQSIMAGLLHDVLEDSQFTKTMLTKKFGAEVAELVDGVTKLTMIDFETRAEAQAENFRKMILAMARDIRVILIKLADRLHNMRTLSHLSPERRQRIAKETLEIYAPIANRLGINRFRIEFEDHGFEMLYPLRFRVMAEAVRRARGHRKEIMQDIEQSLREALDHAGLKHCELVGREKHLYSIYQKMRRKHLPFSEVMDIYAFRIVAKSVDDCYRALGVIHNLYKPFPRHFKDYIAIPKSNGYQSLHTVLFGPYGVPVEIQIRTQEMNKMAENGIAAHWLYKSENSVVNQAQLRAREWIKGLLEIQQSAGNSLEFIESVKVDLFPDEVYVFTPKGDIMKLPNGATAVDFAYAVHTDIGSHCVAVKIDRRLAPLSTHLRNGQTVTIVTAPNGHPNPAWLDFVVTGKARSRIRQYLKHQQRSESIHLGERLLNSALARFDRKIENVPAESIDKVLKASQLEVLDDLFVEIGLGNQVAQIVAQRLCDVEKPSIGDEQQGEGEALYIRGTEGMVIHFAKCCHPIPGDPIIGVLTAGKGLVIHHEGCRNLQELRRHPDRCLSVRWEPSISGEFEAELRIEIIEKRGVYAGLALAVAEAEANIDNINLNERHGNYGVVTATVMVCNQKHLKDIMRRMKKLDYVMTVARNYND